MLEALEGEAVLGVVAIIVSVMAVVFAGYQARVAAQQTRLQRVSSELSFNLQIVEQLNSVLLEIADRPEAHDHIWGTDHPQVPARDNQSGHVLTQALIAVLEMAAEATIRLPGFAVHEEDWNSYFTYVFERSTAVRQEAQENPLGSPVLHRRLLPNGAR